RNIQVAEPEQCLFPSLGRLERFAMESTEAMTALLPYLNEQCTHLYMRHIRAAVIEEDLRRTLRINPGLLKHLTHLRIGRLEGKAAFHILCDNATELRHLTVSFDPRVSDTFFSFYLSPILQF